MKFLSLKLAFVTVLIGTCSFGFTPKKTGVHLEIEKNIKTTDTIFITYDDLPPFVKEFLYKGYQVLPEDISDIIKIKDGAFLVKMNRSFNVFAINTKLEMHHEKLGLFNIKSDLRGKKQIRTQALKTKRISSKRISPERTIINREPEIAWSSIPLNIREYLIKRMGANENQVYKAFDLGNDTYKFILKKAHDAFVILEESPDEIALEHEVLSLLN